MKNKWLLVLLIAAATTAGCRSSGSKTSAMANDMCGCFNLLRDSLPPEAMNVFKNAAVAENAKESFSKGMQALTPEAAMKVNNALQSTGQEGSRVNDCLEALDKKYKTTVNDQQEMAKKMIAELKGKTGCDIWMTLMRINLKD